MMESPPRDRTAIIDGSAAGDDIVRFRNARCSAAGPIPDTTMAISLEKDAPRPNCRHSLEEHQGDLSSIQYPTDDF